MNRIIKYALAAMFLLLAISIFITSKDNSKTSIVQVEVAPRDSKITINNKGVREGENKVEPGAYLVVFSREGFNQVEKKITVKKGESVYVADVLVPNSPETTDWYTSNLEDAKRAEGISSKNFDARADSLSENFPLLRFLPQSFKYFSISYGSSINNPDDRYSAAVYIKAAFPEDRQAALKWIRERGYNPTDYEIIFSNFANPFLAGD